MEVKQETAIDPASDSKKPEANVADEGGQFVCSCCGWSERYHGHGASVPFARGIVFNEDAYVMRDPFVPYGQNLYFFLGAACSSCHQLVCTNCSLFYAKRFCGRCAGRDIQHFPVEIQKKIRDLQITSK